MHKNLITLPKVLLLALGRTGHQDQLASVIDALPHATDLLCQHRNGTPYTLAADRGLDLMLQCTTPEAPESERQWGLHSLTLHAGQWAGLWPEGLEPRTATAQDLVHLFTPDFETALVTPTMVCCTTPGLSEGQEWSVLCLFDGRTHQLQSFSLIRVGEWLSEHCAPVA